VQGVIASRHFLLLKRWQNRAQGSDLRPRRKRQKERRKEGKTTYSEAGKSKKGRRNNTPQKPNKNGRKEHAKAYEVHLVVRGMGGQDR